MELRQGTETPQQLSSDKKPYIEVPKGVRVASSTLELQNVMPFSWEMGVHRQRSFESRKLHVRFMPRPEDFVASHQGIGSDAAAATQASSEAAATSEPAKRRPCESYLEVVYPFSSHAALREQYQRFESDRLRFGLLLEDLDTLAGDVAVRHCGLRDRALVTASIDRITWMMRPLPLQANTFSSQPATTTTSSLTSAATDPTAVASSSSSSSSSLRAAETAAAAAALPHLAPAPAALPSALPVLDSLQDDEEHVPSITLDRDLRLVGQVTWVGRSSVEVLIEISSRRKPGSHPEAPRCQSHASTAHGITGTDSSKSSSGSSGSGGGGSSVSGSGDHEWQLVGAARFVMVSRRKDMTGGMSVPQLELVTPRDRLLFAMGEAHMQQRKRKREHNLERVPPSAQEIAIVHDLLRTHSMYAQAPSHGASLFTLTSISPAASSSPSSSSAAALPASPSAPGSSMQGDHHMHGSGAAEGGAGTGGGTLVVPRHQHLPPALHHGHREAAVAMRRTLLQSSCLMHSQDRNRFNAIFGGHLLRLAFEHAFATAALHAGEWCDPVSMDDVAFLLPVPIGCLMRFSGQVVYTSGPVIRVHVRASKLSPGAPEQPVVTNVFSFAFIARSGAVRHVVPETMVEAMEYVQGHRQHMLDVACTGPAGEAQELAAPGGSLECTSGLGIRSRL